jgi:hypothetical protein
VELRLLKSQGVVQIDKSAAAGQQDRRTDTRNGMHDDIYYEAQAAVQDPKFIRAEQRNESGASSPCMAWTWRRCRRPWS